MFAPRHLLQALTILALALGVAAVDYRARAPEIGENLPWSRRWSARMISLATALEIHHQPDAQFVDARNREDFARGHVEGARLLPWAELARKRGEGAPGGLDPAAPTVVYCSGLDCDSSRLVASELLRRGFERVSIMEAGYDAWEAAGYPVARSAGEAGR